MLKGADDGVAAEGIYVEVLGSQNAGIWQFAHPLTSVFARQGSTRARHLLE